MHVKSAMSLIGLLLVLISSHAWCNELLITPDSIEIEDGDTLSVRFSDGRNRVQLADIDAPEDRENAKFKLDIKRTGLDFESLIALGAIATGQLQKLLVGSDHLTLIYNPDKRDRYGRLIGELLDEEGISVSEKMVSEGYAVATPSKDSKSPHPYETLQREAERKKRGLWGLLPSQMQRWAGVTTTDSRVSVP